MTSAPASTDAGKARNVASGALLLGVLGALVSAVWAWQRQTESWALSLVGGGIVGSAGIAVLWRPGIMSWLRQPVWCRVSVVGCVIAVAWLLVIGGAVGVFTVDGWDGGAYLSSGLALRGFPTEYAAHRAPVSGVVAALFVDRPSLYVVVMTSFLIVLMAVWGVRRWGASGGLLPLALLLFQNRFLESLLEITSELPAAGVLVAGCFLVARERFVPAGIAFALLGLTRWNMAVVGLAMTAAVAGRFGLRSAAALVGGAVLVGAGFLAASLAFVEHPFRTIYEGNFRPALAWADVGEAPPNFFSRVRFYTANFFFVTPPALVVLGGWAFALRRHWHLPAEAWCLRVAVPLVFWTYAVTMLNVGGHFPRFMVPVIPIALLALTEFLLGRGPEEEDSRRPAPGPLGVVMVCGAMGFGLWPASVVLAVRARPGDEGSLSAPLRSAIARDIPSAAVIYVPPLDPLSRNNGYPLMVALRRMVSFPTAKRVHNGGIFAEPDALAAAETLRRAVPPGAWLILPREVTLHDGEKLVAQDGRWNVVLRPMPPVSPPGSGP
jgi:hypothetical protein